MVGDNPFNPSARDRVLAVTDARGIGVYVMFAVRKALASRDGVRRVVADLVSSGRIDPTSVRRGRPARVPARAHGGAASLPEAAYRFARHEPGCHVVLTGTGYVDHLADDVASINGPPAPRRPPRPPPDPLRPRRHRHRGLSIAEPKIRVPAARVGAWCPEFRRCVPRSGAGVAHVAPGAPNVRVAGLGQG